MDSILSGNEAVARAALDAQVRLGTGYPGTPSTEILETLSQLGGRAQWAPNEKVALEVGIGVAFTGARAIVTMKHVGLNVAADPLFTAAYTGVSGALIVVAADDPGMASSQNEQDSRRFAVAAGLPMLEPSDSQEAYDFTLQAIEISERWEIPVILRMTTRVCHSKTVVKLRGKPAAPKEVGFRRNPSERVMIPAYARAAHRRLRAKLAEIGRWNDAQGPSVWLSETNTTGVITSGISYQHVREAAPAASVLKIGMTHPLPLETMRAFAATLGRCLIVEEGDPYLYEAARTAGIPAEAAPSTFRFGELNVSRIRRILYDDPKPEPPRAPGKPPALCQGCSYRTVFTALKNLDCLVAGDIGCYSLGALAPFEAIDTLVCMGASIGTGLGMRHALPREQARRVVSVIGDSTFVHSGITGLVEMLYNPPESGHVVLLLDNGTTAMTGLQEHPGTGRTLEHEPTVKVNFEAVARALGVKNVHTIDPAASPDGFENLLKECLASGTTSLIISRRDCLLAAGDIRKYGARV